MCLAPVCVLSTLAPRASKPPCTSLRTDKLTPAADSPEPSFKTHQKSGRYISAPGKWSDPSSAGCYGNVAIRTSSSSITVSHLLPSPRKRFANPAVPSDVPAEVFPHTLHSRHRQYHDPSDMERYVTFTEPHRIRYISDEGVCIHDQYITVRYEFTSVDGSFLFQGDVRRKDLIDFYDVDVVWTNVHGRTDSYGKVKGIGAIQRLKIWRDRYTTCHSLSVLANKTGGSYREYDVHTFEGELRGREDRAKQVRLVVHGRRGSAPESSRRSLAQRIRPRRPSTDTSDLDIRYLSIQFTHGEGMFEFCLENIARADLFDIGRVSAVPGNLVVCTQL